MANNQIKIHISAENQEFVEKMKEVVGAIRGAGSAAGQASLPIESTSTKLAKMGAIAAGAYSAIKMVGAAVKETIAPIFSYSSALEQNTIAFETFLGNAKLAKQYLGDLQKIAADTPFDLPGVTAAGKKLLAFGFSAKQSLQMLRTIGDTSAGLGMGTAGIERITLAIGQIKAKGKLMGDELLQLTEAGIPAYTILANKLGLTASQISNIGNAGIDADKAIEALLEGMNDKFGGLSSKIADTKQGMISTIKDNAMSIGEFILRPLDEKLTEGIRKIRDWTDKVADSIRKGDIKGAYDALFPKDLIPVEWSEKVSDISKNIKQMFNEASALSNQFGDDGKNAVMGITSVTLDLINGFITISRVTIKAGNDLLYIVRSIVPEGIRNFITMKSTIEFAIKALAGFFIMSKIIALVKKLKDGYVALRLTIIATSKSSMLMLTTMSTNLLKAVKGVKSLRDVVLLLGKAFKTLTKSNILLFIVSIGVAAFGDKIMEWIDKYLGKQKDDDNDDSGEDDKPPNDRTEYPDAKGSNPLNSGDDSKYYQEQSKTLNQSTQRIKQYYDSLIGKMEHDLEELNNNYDENGNIAEQSQKIEQIKYNIAEARYAQAQQIYNAIQDTAFEDATDKELKLGEVKNDLEKFGRELNDAAKGLNDISSIGKNVTSALNSFGDSAVKAAENRLGVAYGDKNVEPDKLVCTQLVIESWKDAGLSFANSASEWVPTLIDQAKAKGLWRDASSGYVPKKGDAIVVNGDSHVGLADGNGGIYHASSGRQRVVHDADAEAAFGTPTGYIAASDLAKGQESKSKNFVSNMKKYQQDFARILEDGRRVSEELAAAVGDVSTSKINKTISDYDEKITKFKNNGLLEFASQAEQLKTLKIKQLEFNQIGQNIEMAYKESADSQKDNLNEVATGVKSALSVADDAANCYEKAIKGERENLKSMLDIAKKNKWTDFANQISDQLDKINNNIMSFYENSLAILDERLKQRLALINSDPNLTNLQKQDLSDDAKREHYQESIKIKKKELDEAFKNDDDDKVSKINFEIRELQNQLNGLGTTLDKVHQASKQAFEDGLIDFLQKGIFECKSLGDAFSNLAITVLQSIQKVYAEAMAKNIMKALFGGSSDNSSPGSSFNFTSGFGIDYGGGRADGGSLSGDGKISGPGTGTSDSIFMWADNMRKMFRVSDGEWVMKQKAVNYYGPNIMAAINRGLIPKSIFTAHAKYANGGSLRGLMPNTGVNGAYGLTADLVSNTPNVNVVNRIDGNGIINALNSVISSRVDKSVEKNMIEKSKLHSMMMKKVW